MHNERFVTAPTSSTRLGPEGRARALSLAAVLASTVGLGLAYGIGYTVTAKDGQQSWKAHCTSVYRRQGHEDWTVIQHAQVPAA